MTIKSVGEDCKKCYMLLKNTAFEYLIHDLHRKLRIWSHLLKISLMKNFIFYAVADVQMAGTLGNGTSSTF